LRLLSVDELMKILSAKMRRLSSGISVNVVED